MNCPLDGPTMSRVDGNTKSSSTRVTSSKNWIFTLNNPSKKEKKILEEEIIKNCSDFRVQEEKGTETETTHLQGYIQLERRGRPFEKFSNKRIHWEKCRNANASREYCCKQETATGNYTFDSEEQIETITPTKDWQLEILDIVNEKPDYRKIYWYWEESGNTGKSALTKYLCVHHNALNLSGKGNDCKHAIVSWKEKKKVYPKLIIFDIPRTNIDYISYEAIESIKNGVFFSGKYESAQVIMNSPHIFIFANTPPIEHKVSADRWIIKKITN